MTDFGSTAHGAQNDKIYFSFFVFCDEIDYNWNVATPNAFQFISYIEFYMYNVCGKTVT